MDQYNQVPGSIQFESSSKQLVVNPSLSHLERLVHRLQETVDKQQRQISRLESAISEVKHHINSNG